MKFQGTVSTSQLFSLRVTELNQIPFEILLSFKGGDTLKTLSLRRSGGHLEVRKRYPVAHSMFKGLFIWWEGAPANRATRLQGLKHSPPLHATRLTGTVSGLRELPFERPLSTTNRHGKTLFSILFQLPARTRTCSLPETRLLH